MNCEIKMPEAGFSVTEGKVVACHKRVGEPVIAGQTIVSVETEKITVDIPAETPGTLQEIRVKEGEVAPVGGALGVVAHAGASAAAGKGAPSTVSEPSVPAVSISGAGVFAAGVQAPKGDAAPSGVDRGRSTLAKRRISPLAKAVARKRGIDPAAIAGAIQSGSGPEGGILREDVLHFLQSRTDMGPSAHRPERLEAVAPAGPDVPADARSSAASVRLPYGQKILFSGWRKVVADRMTAAVRSASHYTMSVDVDVTELAALIASARERLERPKLTYLPFVMKACAAGIETVPEVNSYVFDDGFSLQIEVNIGVAVDIGEKLLVPVIRNVGAKSILQLAGELETLVQKARSEKLDPMDIEGGTFTITNVGVYGIHSGTSILFQPQSAILYIGAAREEPAVVGGQVAVRKRMVLGATFDHRLVHGGPGARFLREVKNHLENIASFILNLR
jgi:pyruvate/2-oxoglutarate dehydrogenase complex dihydrolipoamide acyltransferase (E2) component